MSKGEREGGRWGGGSGLVGEWVGGWMRREEVREGLARTVTDQLKSLHLVNEGSIILGCQGSLVG